jgi:hypothetical protein
MDIPAILFGRNGSCPSGDNCAGCIARIDRRKNLNASSRRTPGPSDFAPLSRYRLHKNRTHGYTTRIHNAITYPCGLLNGASFATRSITL